MKDKNLRDLHYKNRTMRLADETWAQFKDRRIKSGKSWNRFISSLLKLPKKHEHNKGENR